MTTDAQRFDQLAGELDYPMFIVTTSASEEQAGCLVGFTSQVSIDPARFLVGISNKNRTCAVARTATHLAIHLIDASSLELARLFGEQTGDEIDKFALCAWTVGPNALPVLDDAVAWFSARILRRDDFGDHIGHLLAPETVELRGPLGSLLTSFDVRSFDAGHDA